MANGELGQLVPDLSLLPGCTQDERHHCEGDVWEHTLLVVERMLDAPSATPFHGVIGLLHDVGKPACRAEDDGKITFYHHDRVGAEMIAKIGVGLDLPQEQWSAVEWLVAEHMHAHVVSEMRSGQLETILRSPFIDDLIRLQEADAICSCRSDGSHGEVHRDFFQLAIKNLQQADVEAARLRDFKKLIDGRVAAQAGAKGPGIGQVLAAARAAWDAGDFADADKAVAWVTLYIQGHPEVCG